jgi:hypothetical protein
MQLSVLQDEINDCTVQGMPLYVNKPKVPVEMHMPSELLTCPIP